MIRKRTKADKRDRLGKNGGGKRIHSETCSSNLRAQEMDNTLIFLISVRSNPEPTCISGGSGRKLDAWFRAIRE